MRTRRRACSSDSLRVVTLFAAVALSASAGVAHAQLRFPALTGRVVDDAHVLSPEARSRLDTKLADYERRTGHQIVVATVPSLGGSTIEEYGYQLGRAWGIGRAETNDGAVLLVSKGDRKVRIEVGYGLEGQLTDALCSSIVQTVILPEFRAARFDAGVEKGVDAILSALGGTYEPPAAPAASTDDALLTWLVALAALAWLVYLVFNVVRDASRPSPGTAPTQGRRRRSALGPGFGGGGFGGGGHDYLGGGSSGRSGRGGGFGGGGGSFGGGGSSGGW